MEKMTIEEIVVLKTKIVSIGKEIPAIIELRET